MARSVAGLDRDVAELDLVFIAEENIHLCRVEREVLDSAVVEVLLAAGLEQFRLFAQHRDLRTGRFLQPRVPADVINMGMPGEDDLHVFRFESEL